MLESIRNLLQGLELGALRSEEQEMLDELQAVLESFADGPHCGVICECLVALALTRGSADAVLATLAAFVTVPAMQQAHIQLPGVLDRFLGAAHQQRFPLTRQPSWLDCVYDPARSAVDTWQLPSLGRQQHPVEDQPNDGDGTTSTRTSTRASEQSTPTRRPAAEQPQCMATDGASLFVQLPGQLLKVGTGFAGTQRGVLTMSSPTAAAAAAAAIGPGAEPAPAVGTSRCWLGFVDGVLCRRHHDDTPGLFAVVDQATLEVTGVVAQPESDSLVGSLPHALFSTADAIGVIEATEAGWRVRYLRLVEQHLKCVSSHLLSTRYIKMVAAEPRWGQVELMPAGAEADPVVLTGNDTANVMVTSTGEVFVQGRVEGAAVEEESAAAAAGLDGSEEVGEEPSLAPAPTDPWNRVRVPGGHSVVKAVVPAGGQCLLLIGADGKLYGLGNVPTSADRGPLGCALAAAERYTATLLYSPGAEGASTTTTTTTTTTAAFVAAAPTITAVSGDGAAAAAAVVAATVWDNRVVAALSNGVVVTLEVGGCNPVVLRPCAILVLGLCGSGSSESVRAPPKHVTHHTSQHKHTHTRPTIVMSISQVRTSPLSSHRCGRPHSPLTGANVPHSPSQVRTSPTLLHRCGCAMGMCVGGGRGRGHLGIPYSRTGQWWKQH
jgi:hypothetical protein